MNGMRRHASALIQGALVLALIALLVLLVSNLLANMKMRGIQTGLDFLLEPVGFDISESWLTHTAEDPFWHAFLVGLINTLDRKSTRLNSSHSQQSRMPSSA